MIVLSDEDLSKYSSIRIGGIAKTMLIPENTEELIGAVNDLPTNELYCIGAGTNLLINDRTFDMVICLRDFNTKIKQLKNGLFEVGASVRIHDLIDYINIRGYGGIEYLYSVPGLVGGAIVMNAGRGKEHLKAISDHLISVTVIINGKEVTLGREECEFGYRTSIFQSSSCIVVSALFDFIEKELQESDREKKERIEFCRDRHDLSKPNFGSVFSESDSRIMSFVRKIRLGGKRAHFSRKTQNWIINEKNGSYRNVISVIRIVELMHRLFGKECKREVIVWE